MKNIKFSRLFAAMLFVACLALTACQQQPAESPKKIEGTWVNSAEKYVITSSKYDNYFGSNGNYTLYYSTTDVDISEINGTSGFVYGKFNDASHIGFGAKVGQWYALYYYDLTETSVKFVQAWKAGGKAGCDTLAEAKSEYTIANGYFPTSNPSTCTKK